MRSREIKHRPYSKRHLWRWSDGHKVCIRCGLESTTGAWTPNLSRRSGSYWCRVPGGEWLHYGSAGDTTRLPICKGG